MKSNPLVRAVSILLLVSILVITSNVGPILADSDVIRVPEHYSTIQEAVDAANQGDTIIVSEGTYVEGQIEVYKPLTLMAEGTVVVDGLGEGHVISVTANNITITGFTVKNSKSGWGYGGISLRNVRNCTLSGNKAVNNTNGISVLGGPGNNVVKENVASSNLLGIGLYGARNNVVKGNTLKKNHHHGIRLYYSSENIIQANTVTENGVLPGELGVGIYLHGASWNVVKENMLTGNLWTGIMVWIDSDENVIEKNIISKSFNGIYLAASKNNTIHRNAINSSSWAGIKVRGECPYNKIVGNSITYTKGSPGAGIFLDRAKNNTISINLVSTNRWGIFLETSNTSGNMIYHNSFVNNTWFPGQLPFGGNVYNFDEHTSINIWDNGYPSGGNYWSDYVGVDLYSGPYQNKKGSDGIGDAPYEIDVNNQDNYPFVSSWVPMIQDLIEKMKSWNLHKGTQRSLIQKLEDSKHLLNQGNENGAAHKLMDFVNQVEASRESTLTNEQADYLISEAQRIIDLIKE